MLAPGRTTHRTAAWSNSGLCSSGCAAGSNESAVDCRCWGGRGAEARHGGGASVALARRWRLGRRRRFVAAMASVAARRGEGRSERWGVLSRRPTTQRVPIPDRPTVSHRSGNRIRANASSSSRPWSPPSLCSIWHPASPWLCRSCLPCLIEGRAGQAGRAWDAASWSQQEGRGAGVGGVEGGPTRVRDSPPGPGKAGSKTAFKPRRDTLYRMRAGKAAKSW